MTGRTQRRTPAALRLPRLLLVPRLLLMPRLLQVATPLVASALLVAAVPPGAGAVHATPPAEAADPKDATPPAGTADAKDAGAPAAGPADPHAAPPADVDGLRGLLAGAGLAVAPMDSLSLVLKDTTTGVQMIVFVEDAGASLQAVLPYPGRRTVPLATLQQWNATRRFGRAYADRRGAPVLATDLALGPGVGQAAVVAWAELALALGDRFRQEAWPRPGPPPEPARE
jgi:hypothetical protein